MDLYGDVSGRISALVTRRYSTSFRMASRLFSKAIRQDIYNIYGFVRIADEVVDTYMGQDTLKLLDELEQQVLADLKRGYSTNPVVHAFVSTCRNFSIDKSLIVAFMKSMRMDAVTDGYTTDKYQEYIYGSAEVVGLMCLRVFCRGDDAQYVGLESGARALGSAFQKVNFLRDIADDHQRLGRYYFPVGSFETFDEDTKTAIIADIQKDFAAAEDAVRQLPASARKAVRASQVYYRQLLRVTEGTSADALKRNRVRVPNWQKLGLLMAVWLGLR